MINRRFYEIYVLPLFVMIAYSFLYAPIIVLMFFSFNNDQFGYQWAGFTYKWYLMLFGSTEIWQALQNSLIIAGAAVMLSSLMAIGLLFYGVHKKIGRYVPLFYAGIAIPEIVLAVGLLSFFYFFSIPLGFITLIICHTLIGLGYMVPILHARFDELDKRLVEASLDLGATRTQTFFSVILPFLLPALMSGALLVFIISFDDFILSFFCAGSSVQTLPLYIFSMLRIGASPLVSALSVLLLLVSSMLILLFSSMHIKRTGMLP